MSAVPQVTSAVYFAEDICERLQISRSTLKRLRRVNAFPIPELPSFDKRPRWAIADVEAFIATKRKIVTHGRQSARLRAVPCPNPVLSTPLMRMAK